MSRHSLIKAMSLYVATEYFCVGTEFGQDQEFLRCDKIFYVATELAKVKRIMSRQSLAQTEDFRSQQNILLSRSSLGQRPREFDVATELFEIYVTTEYILRCDREFQDIKSSMSRHSVCRNSEARRCVVIGRGTGTTETLCRARQGWVHTTKTRAR